MAIDPKTGYNRDVFRKCPPGLPARAGQREGDTRDTFENVPRRGKGPVDKVRVGVIGVGYLGSRHAQLYAKVPGAQLVGLSDIDPSKKPLSRKLRVPFYQDHWALLDKVDAVSIAVPTKEHHRIARDSLQKGIHVLIEKPMTITVEEADELIALAKQKKCLIQVGHVERFNSAFQAALPFVKSPMFIECHRLGPFKRRSLDVGVVLDLMIHDIDIMLSLVESPVERLDGIGINVLTSDEDIANARITFQNGAVANLTASRMTQRSLRKIRIFAEETYISMDTESQKVVRYWKENGKIHGKGIHFKRKEPLFEELASFVDAVRNHQMPVVAGEDAREALRVALEIRDKIRQHVRWPTAEKAATP